MVKRGRSASTEPSTTRQTGNTLDRRFKDGMGWCSKLSRYFANCPGNLERNGFRFKQQQQRVTRNSEVSKKFSCRTIKQGNSGVFGQPGSGLHDLEKRFHKPFSPRSLLTNPGSGGPVAGDPYGSSYQGTEEPFGGFTLEETTPFASRANALRNFVSEYYSGLRVASGGGLVCERVQREAPTVCIVDSNGVSNGPGRILPELGGLQVRLGVSSPFHDSSHSLQVEERGGGQNDAGCSGLAQPELVQHPNGNGSETVCHSTRFSGNLSSNKEWKNYEVKHQIEANRILNIKNSLPKALSEETINLILHTTSKTSEIQYQTCYNVFISFLKKRNWFGETIFLHVVEFFSQLIQLDYNYNTLLVYRSALRRPVLGTYGMDIVENQLIQNLFKSAKSKARSQNKCKKVEWDLELVLRMLDSRKFLEACASDWKLRFMSDFFLVLVANPLRISEFHSLVVENIDFKANGSVCLKPFEGFIPKNQTIHFVPNSITIPCYKENKNLCPVVALKRYLSKTEEICRTANKARLSNLWLNFRGDKLSKLSMRNWLKKIVSRADPQVDSRNLRFHSIRGVVSTNVFHKLSLPELLKSMNWSSESTYFKHYARICRIPVTQGVLAGNVI